MSELESETAEKKMKQRELRWKRVLGTGIAITYLAEPASKDAAG